MYMGGKLRNSGGLLRPAGVPQMLLASRGWQLIRTNPLPRPSNPPSPARPTFTYRRRASRLEHSFRGFCKLVLPAPLPPAGQREMKLARPKLSSLDSLSSLLLGASRFAPLVSE